MEVLNIQKKKMTMQNYIKLYRTNNEIGSQEYVSEFTTSHSYGSTDVGDVSWVVPTAGIRAATWVPGTAAHSGKL